MSKFCVVQLTQEALKVQCKVDDFEQWGAPTLNLEQYQRKEELQRATPFSQRGSIFWALVEDIGDPNLVTEETVLYCHCESHRFNCVVCRSSGEIERGYSHHIGSVFTLPDHRKKGLATLFMKEVAKQLKLLPKALVSVLYSDIGPTYYGKLGWKLHPSKMATLDVANPRNAKIDNRTHDELVLLSLDEELDKFLAADNVRLVKELSGANFERQEAFVVLPTRDSVKWQFCIGEHFARVREFEELPSRCGVKLNEDAFLIWCHNVKESTLYIVRARFPANAADIARLLLNAALEEARNFQLKKVAVWNPPPVVLGEDVGRHLEIEFVEREDSLSSAMVFGRDGDEDSATPLPHWLGNEKSNCQDQAWGLELEYDE